MKIQNISKPDAEIIVTMSTSDTICLCNAIYKAINENYGCESDTRLQELYADLMLARDLSQYGHLDTHSFNCIAEARETAIKLRQAKNQKSSEA